MAEQRGFFAAWVEQDKERLTEDILKAVRSHTEPKIGLVHVPRDEKQIWDESKQGDRTKLIEEYLQAAEEVKKNKKLPPSESLKKLITPLINLRNITFPPGYESRLKFIVEDIDLEKELGENPPIPTTSKYTIIKDTELRELGILRVSSQNIRLAGEYADDLCKQWKPISRAEFEKIPYAKEYSGQDEQTALNNALDIEQLLPYIEPLPSYWSVSDIYELWLPTLTPEKMKSNDLLDRILVTYTIKRALNQDEKAIDKLCSLFQNTAKAVAVKMAKKRGLFKRCGGDAKAEAIYLLWLMISGYPPKFILDGLNGNFDIPKSVEIFYVHWLSEEVPERLKKYPLIDPFDVLVLLNPITPIALETNRDISREDSYMFKSLSFRPNKKTNLYAWLFGTDKNPMQGRLCQEISDYLDEFTTKQKKVSRQYVNDQEDYEDEIRHAQVNRQRSLKRKKPPRFDENDPDGNVLDKRAIVANSIPEEQNKSIRLERLMDEYKQALIKRGISERDATVTLSSILEEYTNDEMSKQYNLSESSIEKILSKCKPVLKKILEAEL